MDVQKIFSLIIGIVISSQTVVGLNPSIEYKSTPEKLKMKFEERKVQTPDGASINLWYFPSPRITNKLVIVSHNGDGNMGNNLTRIKSLLSYGFNVVCYDYRGYGSSSAFAINDEVYLYAEFYKDFEAVYDYSVNNFGKKIYLYGWGIGSTLSITIGYDKPNTYTIVADSPITQYSDLAPRFKKIGSRMYLPKEVSNSYKEPLQSLNGPAPANFRGLLLILGSHDFLFTKSDMELLGSQIKTGHLELYIMDNKLSRENYRNNPTHYMRKVHHFLVNN